MIRHIKKAITLIKQGDYDYLLSAVGWRLPQWLYHYYRSYLVACPNPKIRPKSDTGYESRLISLDDLPLLEKTGFPREMIEERLNSGDRAAIVEGDGEMLTIMWGASGKRFQYLAGSVIDPGDDGIIIYGMFTLEKARNKGLMTIAYDRLYKSYLEDGRNTVLSAISTQNQRSLDIHEKLGFSIVGEAVYFILLGVSICYYRSWPGPRRKIHIFFKRPPDKLKWV